MKRIKNSETMQNLKNELKKRVILKAVNGKTWNRS